MIVMIRVFEVIVTVRAIIVVIAVTVRVLTNRNSKCSASDSKLNSNQ